MVSDSTTPYTSFSLLEEAKRENSRQNDAKEAELWRTAERLESVRRQTRWNKNPQTPQSQSQGQSQGQGQGEKTPSTSRMEKTVEWAKGRTLSLSEAMENDGWFLVSVESVIFLVLVGVYIGVLYKWYNTKFPDERNRNTYGIAIQVGCLISLFIYFFVFSSYPSFQVLFKNLLIIFFCINIATFIKDFSKYIKPNLTFGHMNDA